MPDLSARRQRFIAEYLLDHNGAAAAVRAGYSVRSAKVRASRLLADPDVKRELEAALAAQQERLRLKADDVLRELQRVGFVDPAELDPDGELGLQDLPEDARRAIASVKVRTETDRDGKVTVTREFRFWSKNEALVALGRHLRLFVDQLEATVNSNLSDEERLARVEALLALGHARRVRAENGGGQ
jgi:phage terminase small subunit